MKALVKTCPGVGQMEIMEVPKPQIKPDEVLIKVCAVGICGTDLKIYDNAFACNTPVIVGHEFSGVIEACGEDVKNYHVGQRVIAEQHYESCGECEYCLTGRRHWCARKRSPGYLSDGAFAEYIAANQDLLHILPDTLSFEDGSLIEPMGVVAYAVLQKAGIHPEGTVAILGCGPMALLAVQIVRAAGAAKVIVTGLDVDEKKRFALAKKYGADHIINAQRMDAVAEVSRLTAQRGVDLVIDLTGAPKAILDGFKMLKRGGRFVAVGMPHDPVCLPWNDLVFKAVRIDFSYSADHMSWKKCLSLIERGAVKLEDFTNTAFPLTEWEKAFAVARSGEALKVIIWPQGGAVCS